MRDTKRILAINFGGIGDEILFLPALISLKKEFKDANITLALEPRSKGIKDLTDVVDDLFLIDIKSKNKYTELLRLIWLGLTGKFDLVVSSGGSPFISIILFLTFIRKRYGYNTGLISKLLLTKAVALNKKQYACDMYHDLVTPITKHKTNLPEFNIDYVEKIPKSILIHPGVSKLSVKLGMIKTIPPETWAKVIDILLECGKKVILVGGPDDDACIKTILKTMDRGMNPNFTNYYGQTKNLVDLAKLIASAEKFICSDSAPLHIAVGVRTKTFVIFGPTDYKKLIPETGNVKAITASDNCKLKPCLWERRQTTCSSLECLDIPATKITAAVLNS